MNKPDPPPIEDPTSTPGRLLLLEWRVARMEQTFGNFTRALWSVGGIVVAALVVYYLTSKGAKTP